MCVSVHVCVCERESRQLNESEKWIPQMYSFACDIVFANLQVCLDSQIYCYYHADHFEKY